MVCSIAGFVCVMVSISLISVTKISNYRYILGYLKLVKTIWFTPDFPKGRTTCGRFLYRGTWHDEDWE
jgi:hypothetical protein